MSDDIYKWDAYSDQPAVIRDRAIRGELSRKGIIGTLKTALTSLLLLPVGIAVLVRKRISPGREVDSIGLCVNIDTPMPEKAEIRLEQMVEWVKDLGVRRLLIRIPLADIENLEKYVDFIRAFAAHQLLINILQDRRHIDDSQLLRQSLDRIFTALGDRVNCYQIGNAVNRKKWAFVSLDEYFRFFAVADKLRKDKFPGIKLLGGSVIDFELPNFVRSICHLRPVRYDGTASLLYVDRRGAPENKQLGCDLIAKICWFHTLVSASWKTKNELWITETNWPLAGTQPFAPAVGDCMVPERLQTTFLVRYYLLMMASGRVTACFWHQLVAPGYGLIDNRGEQILKRPAYHSFKLLIELFDRSRVTGFLQREGQVFSLSAKNSKGSLEAVWVNGRQASMKVDDRKTILSITGSPITPDEKGTVSIGDEVIYLLDYSLD